MAAPAVSAATPTYKFLRQMSVELVHWQWRLATCRLVYSRYSVMLSTHSTINLVLSAMDSVCPKTGAANQTALTTAIQHNQRLLPFQSHSRSGD